MTNREITIKSADALFLLNSMQLWFDEGLGRFGDNVVINMFAEEWGPNRTKGVLFKVSFLPANRHVQRYLPYFIYIQFKLYEFHRFKEAGFRFF